MELGWIHPDDRTLEQHEAHARAVAAMQPFYIKGPPAAPAVGTKVLLTDTWKHPGVVSAIGKPFTGFRQLSGSCVGAAGGTVESTLCFTDVILRGDLENIVLPFWPLNYGRSRLYMGEHGPGEGSLGSTFAQSCREDGFLEWGTPGLPQYDTRNQYALAADDKTAQSLEMQWSAGDKIDPKWLSLSRKHLIKTTSQLRSAAEVRDAIVNGYPVTRAFEYFCNPGTARVQDGALVGNYSGRGGHQESWLGYWNHPSLGELIWEQNQWGSSVYGDDPGGGPGGGCWQKFADVDRMCRGQYAEIFSFSQFDGYPAQQLNFSPW